MVELMVKKVSHDKKSTLDVLIFKNLLSIEPRVTYIPPSLPEDEETIFSQYKSGINFDKYDEILVEVSGTNPLPAIMVTT